MVYAEWLRVRKTLLWTGIVLLALIALCAILRYAVGPHGTTGYIAQMQADPESRVTESVAADGARRVTIDQPQKHVRVFIDTYADGHKSITIDDTSGKPVPEYLRHKADGYRQVSDREYVVHIDQAVHPRFGQATFAGAIVAMILATILGIPFARENDGHLEIALTKPIDRVRLGLATFGADAAGIAGGLLLGILFAAIVSQMFDPASLSAGPRELLMLVKVFCVAVAWYALLCAITASLKRGYGMAQGMLWPVALAVVLLAAIDPNTTFPVAVALRTIGSWLSPIVPLTYLHLFLNNDFPLPAPEQLREVALAGGLALVYGAIALWQWRRVEA